MRGNLCFGHVFTLESDEVGGEKLRGLENVGNGGR